MINNFRGKYEFLSNFYSAEITIDSITYPTGEHAFQAMKVMDRGIQLAVSKAPEPMDAKRMGSRRYMEKHGIKIREDWDDIRVLIMRGIVYLKFCKHPDLLRQLIETGNEELVEGNWWNDTFWGVCGGIGENHLGKILMEVRENLKLK